MTVAIDRPLPRLRQSTDIVPWAKQLIDELQVLLRSYGVGINAFAGGSAPGGSAYVTIGNDATLTAERRLAVAPQLVMTDGGANAAVTLDLEFLGGATTAVTSVANTVSLTVDDYGRIVALGENPIGIAASQVTSGTLAVARGGTNIGSYATGDLLYASGAATLATLPISTNGFVLTLAGGLPTWAAAGAASVVWDTADNPLVNQVFGG